MRIPSPRRGEGQGEGEGEGEGEEVPSYQSGSDPPHLDG
jgi:hypothetical protein